MGGSKHKTTPQPQSQALPPEELVQTTPNLMRPYREFMPNEYFSNAPIYNPNNILAAYTANLPSFLEASKSVQSKPSPELVQQTQNQVAANLDKMAQDAIDAQIKRNQQQRSGVLASKGIYGWR